MKCIRDLSVVILAFCLPRMAVADPFILETRGAKLSKLKESVLYVPIAKKAPVLDGELKESAWRKAAKVTEWMEYPSATPMAVKAELRVTSDADHVYVGFTLWPGDMAKANLRTPKKPADDYGGSLLEAFFDPSAKGESKYQSCTNPLGLRYDGRNDDKKWNGKWQSVGKVGKDSWTIEAAFPAEDFGLERIAPESIWEANFAFVMPDEVHISWTGKWGSPGSDYGTFFFGTPEQLAKSRKPSVSVLLDREVYDLRDVTGVALVKLADVDSAVPGLVLDTKLVKGAAEVSSQTITELPGEDIDLTLDVARLEPGVYTFEVAARRGDTRLASSEASFEKKKRDLLAEGPKEGRVPIRVWPSGVAQGVTWPISTGVPFAQGVLASPEQIRLLGPDGKEVACQASVRSTWNRGGTIRWLGVDFASKLAPSQQTYLLEYGPGVKPETGGQLLCQETPDRITITTGPLQFTVGRKQFRLLDSVYLDQDQNGQFEPGEQILSKANNGGLHLIDHEGNRYESAHDRDAEVVVEEQGPVKVTIRATGWYVKKGTSGARTSCELPTDRLCKFTVRISAYEGLPLLRMAVTTVITYDSQKVRLRNLGLGLTPTKAQKVTIGTRSGPPVEWDSARLKAGPYLLQHRWDRSTENIWRHHDAAQGWIEVSGEKASLALAMRNCWKLFPKEIEWQGDSLLVHIWPAHGRDDVFGTYDQLRPENIYKLWYCHQGRELDFRFPDSYYQTLDEECTRTEAFGGYFRAMSYSNAQGLAINNDFLLNFQAVGDASAIPPAKLAYLADEDPHAAPDPRHTCASGVFGQILHSDTQSFGQLEATTEKGFKSISTRTQPNNEHGMFIHGGAHTYWYGWKKPAHAGIHRVWINGHYQIARMPFVQYARTGNPIYLRWVRDFSANLRDIAMVHYASDERRFRYHNLGAMYHCKGFAPWAGDSHLAGHLISMDFLAYDYYLTGNRRSLDVFNEWIEGLKLVSPGGYGTREGIQTLTNLVEAYRLTWDPAVLEIMNRFANAIFHRQPILEQGWWDYNPLLGMRYYELTGSQNALGRYREALEASNGGYGGGAFHIPAYFALLDGKPDLLKPWAPFVYQQSISCVEQPRVYGHGLTSNMWIHHVYFMNKVPYLLKAMQALGVKPERPVLPAPGYLPLKDGQCQVVVRETADQDILAKLVFGRAPSGNLQVKVHRADKTKVLEQELTPVKGSTELAFTIPKDGKTDDYLITIKVAGIYDYIQWPVTSLKNEMAIIGAGRTRLPPGKYGTRLYFTTTPETPPAVMVTSDSKNAMGMELLDAKDQVLGRASDSRYVGDPQALALPKGAPTPLSMYFSTSADLTLGTPHRLVVALRPEALFEPKITEEPK